MAVIDELEAEGYERAIRDVLELMRNKRDRARDLRMPDLEAAYEVVIWDLEREFGGAAEEASDQ